MTKLQGVDADQPNVPRWDDLLSRRSFVFAHPDEVLDDPELTLADKRSLLASWASDALAVKDSPSLRQLANGAVVCVDDIMAALRSLDRNETLEDTSRTISRSFARRGGGPTAGRRNLRPEDDNEPPPSAAGARIPTAQKSLTAYGFRQGQLMGGSDWLKTRGWKPGRVRGARSMASIRMNPLSKKAI